MIRENKDKLIDIYDIWYEPFWSHGWFSLIISIFICFLFVMLLYFVYKKYIQKAVFFDCALFAYRDLDILKKIHIVTESDSKDCYFSLSSIIKRYLACRYHIVFTQLTDKEIVQQARLYMTDDCVRILQRLLQGMTLVKFEHEFIAAEKLEKDIFLVREFIEETTLQQEDIKEN